MIRERPLHQKTLLFIVLVLLFFLFPCSINAELYKYVDEEGIIHFSDKPFRTNQSSRSYSHKIDSFEDYNDLLIETDFTDDFRWDGVIYRASEQFDIDPALIKAIIKVESDFDPAAISRAGAKGLMQLMPMTICDMEVGDPFDPEKNIIGGTKYFKYLLGKFDNDLKISLAAYNAGITVVTKYGGIPDYRETRDFVKKVLKSYLFYRNKIWKTNHVAQYSKNRTVQYVDDNNILHITNRSSNNFKIAYP